MAMRITTKMMQSTSLNNLNTNKALQEKLTTQLSTMKKITRPSDDPVIAIRALKLNSSLSKIDQYYEKNTEDAESWLKLTESAIKTTNEILTDMRSYIVQAANGPLEEKDRKAIIENLSNFEKEIYATGNADSAGRSIFTGYRTDLPLTFKEDKEERYTITEQRTNSILDTATFVRTGDLSSINDGNFMTKETTEYQVDTYEIPRIRLAYSDIDIKQDAASPTSYSADIHVSYLQEAKTDTVNQNVAVSTSSYSAYVSMNATGGTMQITFQDKDGNTVAGSPISISTDGTVNSTIAGLNISAKDGLITFEETNTAKTITLGYQKDTDAAGNAVYNFDERYETTLKVTDCYASASDEAYEAALGDANADSIVYIAETGELLLGSNVQEELSKLKMDDEIRISYEKSTWQEGDLDPIHYFYTKRYDETKKNPDGTAPKVLEYNPEKLINPNADEAKQIMSYDVGSNQTIRVNTTADEVFTHDIGRDVDEVVAMLDEYATLEETYTTVNNMIKSEKYEGEELEQLKTQLAALDKARNMAKKKVQTRCEGLITDFDGYLNQASLAQTNVGSRESRLLLIQNRLGSQQTNFQELVSENEDADVTELAIQLSSVELTYEAALSSISYVMKTSLLDFI